MLALASPRKSDVLVIAISFQERLTPGRGAMERLSRMHEFGFDFVDLQCLPQFPFPPHEALAAVAALSGYARGFRRVLTFGSSVGGFVALRFAGLFGAEAAIVAAPQFSFDPEKMPGERRWTKERKSVPGFPWDDMAPALKAIREIYLIHDSASPEDMEHVRRIMAAAPRTILIPAPYGGHGVSKMLHEGGLLCPTIDDIVGGTFDLGAYRTSLKKARRASPLYLANLADAQPACRDGLRVSLLRMAYRLEPQAEYGLSLLAPLFRLGRIAEATDIIQAIAQEDASLRRRLGGLKRTNANLLGRIGELERQLERHPEAGVPRAKTPAYSKVPLELDPADRRANPAE